MGDLGYRDTTRNVLLTRAGTLIFELYLHIKDSDHFPFTLIHIDVALHTGDLADSALHAILAGAEPNEVRAQPFLCPSSCVFVDPVP